LSDAGFGKLAIRIEPKAEADSIVHDEPLRFYIDLRELLERGIEVFRVAAIFAMPLPAAEGRPDPIRDASHLVEHNASSGWPARIGNRLVSLAALN
jgi:hypothetical protein